MYEVRASGEIRAKDDGKITGHAAVFDQPTMIGSMTEVIRPGAFTRSIEKGIEVKALWNQQVRYPMVGSLIKSRE